MAVTFPGKDTGARENLAQTLTRELPVPKEFSAQTNILARTHLALPNGWSLTHIDDAEYLPAPRRNVCRVTLHQAADFNDYMIRFGSMVNSSIWCDADYVARTIKFTGILNDRAKEETGWRDDLAFFTPSLSEEWGRWNDKHDVEFTQMAFAAWLEENNADIISDEGRGPTGAQILEMALNFETTRDFQFKSCIRLQNGGREFTFVDQENAQTQQKMKVFERFCLGLPVFRGAERYPLNARLKYRIRDGKLVFRFQLIKPDVVFEAAATQLIENIRNTTGSIFYLGKPFSRDGDRND